MKKSFEKWALSQEMDISPYTFDPKFANEFDYNDISTQMFWECWQAASSQPAIEADACPMTEMHKEYRVYSFCPWCGQDIRSA